MKKRLISVALCAVFALGMAATVSSCGKDAEEDLNSFTMFVPCEVPDGYTSYNQLPVYKKLEEITGMKVNYVHGVYSDIQQMWTGDYAEYDVMMISDVQVGAGYPGGVEKGVSDGVLWDMSPYMDECMPNYLSAISESYTSVQKFTKTDSGKRIGIYSVPTTEQGPWYGFVVRDDWLRMYQEASGIIQKDAELKDLVTYDDWESYLTYVKNNLNGGKAPLFLYYTGVDMVGSLNAGYQVSSELYLKGGTEVAYGAIQPEYKQYLDKMKDWYAKGLIDQNFYTNNSGTESQMPQAPAMDNFSEGKFTPAQYAAFPMIYTYIHTYEDIMKAMAPVYAQIGRPQYNLRPVAAPKQNADDTLHIRYTEKSSAYAVLTNKVKSEEKAKAIMKWFDYLFSDEGMMLMNYGVEGDTYTMVDGQPTFTEKITKNEKLSFADAINTYVALNFMFKYDWKRELQVVTAEERSAMEEVWNCDNSYVLPTLTLTETEGRTAEAYEVNAKKYKDEFTVNYIIGKKDLQSFEQFVQQMKTTYHVEDLVKVYQAAYLRYKAR